jgi:hypothetical protein
MASLELHAYQQRARDFILRTPACLCLLSMGLGKTATTLTALSDLLASGEINRVLVVAPKRVAEHTWPAECQTWTPHLNLTVAAGTAAQRDAAVASAAQIVCIGRDNVPWLVERYVKDWPFDALVVDESSSFKNASSQRFKALKKVRTHFARVVLLTATPAPNTLLELWPQVYLCDGGQRLGKAFSGFRSRYFEADYLGYTWTLKKGAEAAIWRAVSDVSVSMRAEDYLSVPDRIDINVPVTLPPPARAAYDVLLRDMVLRLNTEIVTAANAAVLVGKLQQAANGFLYDEDGTAHRLHAAKLEALSELLEAAHAAGENVLVAYHYKADREAIQAALGPLPDVSDKGAIDRWNAGSVPVMTAHPASAGHGLNLQSGGNVIIWFGPTYSLELTQQFNGRLHRQGQTRPVRIYTLTAAETVDEDVIEALHDKDTTQSRLLNALRAKTPEIARAPR